MKKFFIVTILFSLPFFVRSQDGHVLDSVAASNRQKLKNKKDPTPAYWFLWLDGQWNFKERNDKLEQRTPLPSIYLWSSHSRGPVGITSTIYRGGDTTWGFSLSPMYNTTGRGGLYFECSLGPWVEITPNQPLTFAATSYLYFETKTLEGYDRLENGKITSMITAMYYPMEKEWWVQGYIVWTPLKNIGTGLFAESDGSIGPRVQCSIPVGKKGVLSLWTAGGVTKTPSLSFGTNISFEGKWKKRRR